MKATGVVRCGGASPFKLLKTMWGVDPIGPPSHWGHLMARVKDDGFNGIEVVSPGPFFAFAEDPKQMQTELKRAQLDLVMQIHSLDYPVGAQSVDDHIDSFRKKCHEAAEFAPMLINSHSGKDSFTKDDAVKFFEAAVAVEKEIGIPVVHETHRQRILYSAPVYRDLAPHLPKDLKINADLSHFAVVGERCLDRTLDAEFWPAVLDDIAGRCHLIHARVGWAQGPQVNDPFAPEHEDAVVAHMEWWHTIVANMRKRGVPVLVEPEFGPYPYLPSLPYTRQPVVPLWEMCTRFGKLLRANLDVTETERGNRRSFHKHAGMPNM